MKLIFRGRIITNKDEEISVVEEFKLEDGSVVHCMGKPAESLLPEATTANTATTNTIASTSGSTVVPPPAASGSASSSSNASTIDGSSSLSAALNKIRSSYSASDYKTALTTLSKLLSNVIQHPLEEKYRKVKQTNAAFQKRLGRLNGANDAIISIGFETVGEEWILTPSPEGWPKLLESKSTLDRAEQDHDAQQQQQQQQQQANAPDMGFGGIPNMSTRMPNTNMPPGNMDPSIMSSMLSNPQALQSMLQNPMLQQMMQNHPQFANNPMMQEQMRTLANNPQMVQQLSRMMSDPSTMARMNTMMQNAGANGTGMGGLGGAGGANGGMDMNRQLEMMRQLATANSPGSEAQNSANPSANGTNNSGGTNQQESQGGSNIGNNGNGGDGDVTEEEMLAEAIARSLREQ